MDSSKHLNLARKWRSKQFDQVVGQDLSIRMLKNSLYLNQFFPVYLFSGQRGCGKTTTARLFAAALNCDKLAEFQKDPRNTAVPCLVCASCQAMAQGNHPDFIEIDAASHTGVDNVRMVIDAAFLLPVMGKKKIYLIDEAHMLSKAAFNAFLKILEEPPASVIFMLATTDPQKIIDTVRSRCFQLFFTAIEIHTLVKHLKVVCAAESITVQDEALFTIVRETEGSARDALNLLEQVRFSHAQVTQEAVLRVLGHMAEHQLLQLAERVVARDIQNMLSYLQEIKFESYDALTLWKNFQELVRTALFAKYGALNQPTVQDTARFDQFVKAVSSLQLNSYLQILYRYEMILLKTTVQHGLLEMLFIELCQAQGALAHNNVMQSSAPQAANSQVAAPHSMAVQKTETVKPVAAVPTQAAALEKINTVPAVEVDPRWKALSEKIQTLSDPLLVSIFSQAKYQSFDAQSVELVLLFPQKVTFFGDWLRDTGSVWMTFAREIFGESVKVTSLFEQQGEQVTKPLPSGVQKQEDVRVAAGPSSGTPNKIASAVPRNQTKSIDVSDKDTWKTANALLDAFGGTLVEVQENEKTE